MNYSVYLGINSRGGKKTFEVLAQHIVSKSWAPRGTDSGKDLCCGRNTF